MNHLSVRKDENLFLNLEPFSLLIDQHFYPGLPNEHSDIVPI